MKRNLINGQSKLIQEIVKYFKDDQEPFRRLQYLCEAMVKSSEKLSKLAHSVKYRIKDSEHLEDKLIRKAEEANKKNKRFLITKENLFSKINDLVGCRIIHLHTKQFEEIDAELKRLFTEQNWILVEAPIAKTWDDESRAYFEGIGVKIEKSPSMYTSVHYIIRPNSKTKITCEVQVRTLMEEVWGEVDHTINYPHKSNSLSCREQIRVLARVTSSCSRLVDSIFSTHQNHVESQVAPKVKKRPAKQK